MLHLISGLSPQFMVVDGYVVAGFLFAIFINLLYWWWAFDITNDLRGMVTTYAILWFIDIVLMCVALSILYTSCTAAECDHPILQHVYTLTTVTALISVITWILFGIAAIRLSWKVRHP